MPDLIPGTWSQSLQPRLCISQGRKASKGNPAQVEVDTTFWTQLPHASSFTRTWKRNECLLCVFLPLLSSFLSPQKEGGLPRGPNWGTLPPPRDSRDQTRGQGWETKRVLLQVQCAHLFILINSKGRKNHGVRWALRVILEARSQRDVWSVTGLREPGVILC